MFYRQLYSIRARSSRATTFVSPLAPDCQLAQLWLLKSWTVRYYRTVIVTANALSRTLPCIRRRRVHARFRPRETNVHARAKRKGKKEREKKKETKKTQKKGKRKALLVFKWRTVIVIVRA